MKFDTSHLKHWLAPAAKMLVLIGALMVMLAHALQEAAAIADDNRQIV